MLEQRQKEVIELCKSESEEENLENDEVTNNEMLGNTVPKDNSTTENEKHIELNLSKEQLTNKDDADKIEENAVSKDIVMQETVHSDLDENSCENNTIKEITSPISTEDKQVIETDTNETSLLQYSNENDVQMNSSYDQPNELTKPETHNTESESQIMTLHFDSEVNTFIEKKNNASEPSSENKTSKSIENSDDEFMENDFNFDEISKVIDEAELKGNFFM